MHTQTTTADPLNVALIIASVRTQRIGPELASWVSEAAASMGNVDVMDLAVTDLPADSQLQPGGGSPTVLTRRLEAADAVVVLTPEFNHAYPAALKRAIDWHYTEWSFKPVTVVGYGSRSGGAMAVEALRSVFAELAAVTTRRAVLLHSPWEQLDDGFSPTTQQERALSDAMTELAWWADPLRAARRERPFVG